MTLITLLFLLISIPSFEVVNAFNICSERIQTTTFSNDLKRLQEACASDKICSFYYNQSPERKNFTIFEALAMPSFHLRKEDLDSIRREMCSLQSEQQLFQWLWTRELVYTRAINRPVCGVNQVLSLGRDSSMHCECSAGSSCSECVCEQSSIITMLVIVLVILFLICFGIFFDSQKLYRFVDSLK